MPMYDKESSAAKPQFEMDKDQEDRFVRFVERMPPRSDGLVRLFDRGDYFSAHGPDALLIAEQVYKTTNVLKYLGSPSSKPGSSSSAKGLPSATVSMTLAKAFLRDCLTTKQMRVEIYEPVDGAGGRKNHTQWFLAKQASPGNLSQVEDLLFAHEDLLANAVSMALRVYIKDGVRTVGAAFVDVQDKTIGVAEFPEDEHYGNTESLIIQLGIKECIMQEDAKHADHELAKVRTLVERCGVIVTERKASEFQPSSVVQDLGRLLNDTHPSVLPEHDLKQAMSALSALISYLGLLSDSLVHGTFKLHNHDLSQYMKLDASALKALNLMPNPELGSSKNMSLYGLLNYCRTSQGQRLLARWLKQPLVNLHSILERQNIVGMFVDDTVTRATVQDDCLKKIPDFHRISKRFHRGQAGLEDVVRVYQAVQVLPRIIEHLDSVKEANPEHGAVLDTRFTDALKGHSEMLDKYAEMVENTIDLDELQNHNFVLLPTLDNELQSFRDKLVGVRDELDAEHRRVGKALGLDTDKKLHLENHHVYKYSFRITKAEAGLIRNKKQYIELSTQKSGTIFTTDTLRDLSDEFSTLQDNYEEKQRHLVKEVVQIAASYIPVFEQLDDLVAALDVILSFAQIAVSAPIPYIKPTIKEKGSGDVVIHGARHPCLEVQDDIQFISNDHEMRKGTSEFHVITGPNMGGKSTYIRQLGTIALMAQVGCFVPADSAELPIFDCILARVGAGDSQLKGVSTFMAEMLETATILRSATRDSLIIIDELGRGTSTYDGFGLAWAISEHIANNIRCFCLFATHFHELTTLADQLEWVKNLQVRAEVRQAPEGSKQDREITLLYQVVDGHSDQSFGIHVAELARFPESVVKLAKRKAEELEDFGDSPAPEPKLPKTEVEAGTELMRSFLETWRSRTEGASEEQQLKELRRTADEFKERFDGNAWVQKAVEGL
ncbi:MSH2 protein [Vanrija albida]|uniref:MSH2 protein n=1 Tax=Vanrija albida TaxID=181172 RepID=A0ABR3Q631_9TREE